jgi:hypothetical protein
VTLSLLNIRKIVPYIHTNQGKVLYTFELIPKDIDYRNDSDGGTYSRYLNMNFESALDSNQVEESKAEQTSDHKDTIDQKIDDLFKWTDDGREVEELNRSVVHKELCVKHTECRATLDPRFVFRIPPLSYKRSCSFPSLRGTGNDRDDEFSEIFDRKKSWMFGCEDYETFQTWVSLLKANIT